MKKSILVFTALTLSILASSKSAHANAGYVGYGYGSPSVTSLNMAPGERRTFTYTMHAAYAANFELESLNNFTDFLTRCIENCSFAATAGGQTQTATIEVIAMAPFQPSYNLMVVPKTMIFYNGSLRVVSEEAIPLTISGASVALFDAPTGVTGTSTSIRKGKGKNRYYESTLNLKWNPVPGADHYVVLYQPEDGNALQYSQQLIQGYYGVSSGPINGTSASFTQVCGYGSGCIERFRVYAVDSSGNMSILSNSFMWSFF